MEQHKAYQDEHKKLAGSLRNSARRPTDGRKKATCRLLTSRKLRNRRNPSYDAQNHATLSAVLKDKSGSLLSAPLSPGAASEERRRRLRLVTASFQRRRRSLSPQLFPAAATCSLAASVKTPPTTVPSSVRSAAMSTLLTIIITVMTFFSLLIETFPLKRIDGDIPITPQRIEVLKED